MKKFKYKTVKNNSTIIVALDCDQKKKTALAEHLRSIELRCAQIIDNYLAICESDFPYYIVSDSKVIAGATMHDDATLIGEAMAKHSPYYREVNVMGPEGLICHFLSNDFNNDRTNHEIIK